VTEDLSIYFREFDKSKALEIRAELKTQSTLSGFLLFILDAENVSSWLDNANSTDVLQRISPSEIVFVTTFNRFGPIRARDMVIRSKFWQNSDLSVEIENTDEGNSIPVPADTIRMAIEAARWHITPQADQTIGIRYTFIADPKGKLPFWLRRSLALKGIWNTMQNIDEQLPRSKWQQHRLPIIVEPNPD